MLSQADLLGIAGSGALVLRAGGVELIADGGHEAATGMIVPLPELDIVVVTSEDLFERLLFNHCSVHKKKTVKVNNPLKACKSAVFFVFSHPKTINY